MKSNQLVATIAVVVLLAALFAACTGPGSPSPSPSSAAGPEKPAITLGILPIVDVATVQTALRRGHFAAEGLTVTTEFVQGGAAAIPALVGGSLDIAYGAWPSFLNANQQGIPLVAVADGVAATPGFAQLLALPGSGLENDPADLAGRRVAINTLANIGELAVRATLKEAGADPQDVVLVAIPFPDMGAALERGDVDAIWAVEPGVTSTRNSLGAVVVADTFTGALEGFPVAGYQATRAFAETNPNTVAAFQRAMRAAAAETADDAVARASIDEYTELSAEVLAALTLPEYRRELDPAQLRRVYDYLVEFGLLAEGLDVGSLILPGP
ncbi:MAG TPA: ABC transporter substrate-binding protein [Candidatus Limnocylindrales bacterium]|nr:ABC transporter substrate-binding protein [Candidatus Limnocylindrales bacterium]